ncbi:hypothetical protein OC844_005275 [Tilletia horrida]|nr:hypothetical protein OC844_005275 [Tilletia horrida]
MSTPETSTSSSSTSKPIPALIRRVKYLRIWDDVTHCYANCPRNRDQTQQATFPDQNGPKLDDSTWPLLGNLLKAMQQKDQETSPLFALSFRQLHLVGLYDQLRSAAQG